MFISIFILFAIVAFVSAAKHYIDRSHLNETYYGKTRFAVDNFIDPPRMNLLYRMLLKNKHYFYEAPEKCFIFEGQKHYQIFETIIDEEDRKKSNLQDCHSTPDGRSCYDRALHILRNQADRYDSTAAQEFREELEAYVHIRDKIFEYASEALNTTVVSCMGGDGVIFFYYVPKSPVLMTLNGRGYIRTPHVDYYRFQGTYDRPLTYLKPEVYGNIVRRYSATLYFDDIPESSGGVFEWYDFPNNHKLPPETGYKIPLNSQEYPEHQYLRNNNYYSPSFADPDLNITRIQSRKGKLLLFSAQDDLHGVREYSGTEERWALMFALSNKETMDLRRKGVIKQDLLDKVGPAAVVN